MDKHIFKVENPEYLTKDEINERYEGKQVLLTNVKMTPDYSQMHGGIVRYYAIDSMDELWELLAYLRKTEGEDFIEGCTVQYIGPIYSTLLVEGGAL